MQSLRVAVWFHMVFHVVRTGWRNEDDRKVGIP